MNCPLCGYEFNPQEMACHTSCAFNNGCTIVCCPNCGYQMPDESRSTLANAIKALFARRQPPAERCRLSDLHPGQSAQVLAIKTAHEHRAERLHVLGLMPGARVTLEQRRPTMILRVGFTEFTVEREIADEIQVLPLLEIS